MYLLAGFIIYGTAEREILSRAEAPEIGDVQPTTGFR